MFYVGIDLAWSRNNHSGIVILDGNECVLTEVVKEDEEIIHILDTIVKNDPVRIAIDAPLTVPNTT
jgi:predicted nuclease with RNAse H fold